MTPSGISVDLVGEERIFDMLVRLPAEVQDTVLDDVNEYMLNVLRTYPSPKYISRAHAYPEVGGWFSDKQRRWFFAHLNDGSLRIPYRRTQGLRQGWKKRGEGQSAALVNDTPGVEYVMGENTQSRHEALVGWKKPSKIIEERKKRIDEVLSASVKKALRKLGAA